MKKMILGLCIASLLFAGNVRGGLDDEKVEALQRVIKHSGYTCYKVEIALMSNWSGNYRVECDNRRYTYEIKEVGGYWQVEVK